MWSMQFWYYGYISEFENSFEFHVISYTLVSPRYLYHFLNIIYIW